MSEVFVVLAPMQQIVTVGHRVSQRCKGRVRWLAGSGGPVAGTDIA
jgi:hypothetical protein